MVGSIQAIPICCHMNLYSPTLTPNFDLPWPLRPLCDLLDIFFQLQNIQLNRFINGAPWRMAKTCATGFQNLGCYVAKTTFYFIEEPIVFCERSMTALLKCSEIVSDSKMSPDTTNRSRMDFRTILGTTG